MCYFANCSLHFLLVIYCSGYIYVSLAIFLHLLYSYSVAKELPPPFMRCYSAICVLEMKSPSHQSFCCGTILCYNIVMVEHKKENNKKQRKIATISSLSKETKQLYKYFTFLHTKY